MKLRQLFAVALSAATLTMSAVTATPGRVAHSRLSHEDAKARTETKNREADPVKKLLLPTLEAKKGSFPKRSNVMPYPAAKGTMLPSRVTSAQSSRIYGGAIYADNWTEDYQPIGVYSFAKGQGTPAVQEAIGDDYVVTGGGVFANGRYYFTSYMQFMGITLATLSSCSIDDWVVDQTRPVDPGVIAQDMAYDPTTGMVYGCFFNDEVDGRVFGVLNLETCERVALKDLDIILVTVAVNSKGEVYAIGLDGNLYRFDKETGERSLIGATGRRPMYSASGCFDLTDDTFYWECIESDSRAHVYTVDTKTGAATYSTTIENNLELNGMFIPVAEAADKAPAAIDNIDIDFDGNALEGYVVFSLPSISFDNLQTLSGPLGYSVSIDGEEVAAGSGEPGEEIRAKVRVDAPRMYRISVTASNSEGVSPLKMREFWIGDDMPEAVGNVSLTRGDNASHLILTWTAPEATVHGGYVNAETLTYDVTRMPDKLKVASAIADNRFEEDFDTYGKFELYWYVVTPLYNGYEAQSAESNKVGVGVVELPFANPVACEDDFSMFTVIDANGDDETWLFDEISASARIKYSLANNYTMPMNDWLVTPAMHLETGRVYKFSFFTHSYYGYSEKVEVMMGNAPVPEAMTATVVAPRTVRGSDPVTVTSYVTVEEEGIYYFGIHAISPADTMYLYAGGVEVEEGPAIGSPAAVTSLKATAGAQGAYTATLSFKAPVKSVEGGTLDEITEITIFTKGRVVHRISDAQPGETYTFTDDKAIQGDNTYTVTAYNSHGEGLSAEVTVYVGHDRPDVPGNIKARENNGSVVITWTAPTVGETGGYIDPATLTYAVVRATDEKELATDLTELTFTDNNPPLNGYRQEFQCYYVYACSPAGYGYGKASNIVAVGTPFEVPFTETFANGTMVNTPWDVEYPEESEGYWRLMLEGEYPDTGSQDIAGGLVSFIPESGGDSGQLISGMIDFQGLTNPVAEFWWYYQPDANDTIGFYVMADGEDPVLVKNVKFAAEDGEAAGWRKTSVSLAQFKGAKYIQLVFDARSAYGYTNIHIDNIRVKDLFTCNLTANAIEAPRSLKAYDTRNVKVVVENTGSIMSGPYKVTLLRDGEPMATLDGTSLDADATTEFIFPITPDISWNATTVLQGKVEWALDENEADNLTSEKMLEVIMPKLPYVETLDATFTDKETVLLEWDEPDTLVEPKQLTDDVESYRAFSINGFGDWRTIDVDGAYTYGINNGAGGMLAYENAGSPMAFIAFNPAAAGIDVEDENGEPTAWAPHSGDQMFCSFACENAANDDWLISPELSGDAQEISFFVKSVTAQFGFEKYEVWYSTTGTELGDFERVGDVRSAPIEWVEEKVALPAGARYFAIRCISNDCYVFMLDDITFVAATGYPDELSLIGYNVYRDGELLTADAPVADAMYEDLKPNRGVNTYAVTAVYDKGESRMSASVAVNVTYVVAVEGDTFRIEAGRGRLTVTNAIGAEIAIADTDGRRVSITRRASEEETYLLEAGVYVVTVDGTSIRVLVK